MIHAFQSLSVTVQRKRRIGHGVIIFKCYLFIYVFRGLGFFTVHTTMNKQNVLNTRIPVN